MMQKSPECLLTTKQVMDILNVSRTKVYRLREQKELLYVELGSRAIRFRPEDVDDYIRKNIKGD